MTRINCVHPSELSRQHLLAEYRELPRLFALVLAAQERGEHPTDPRNPTRYVLGPGHVRFFYPRLGYIGRRFHQLVDEMDRRGYEPRYRAWPVSHRHIRVGWFGEWEPDASAVELNRMRIAQRFFEAQR